MRAVVEPAFANHSWIHRRLEPGAFGKGAAREIVRRRARISRQPIFGERKREPKISTRDVVREVHQETPPCAPTPLSRNASTTVIKPMGNAGENETSAIT